MFLPDGDSRYVVNMSDSAIFQCNATGVPPPLIQWFRGQELLNMSTDTRITLSDPYVVDPPRELATVGRTLTIRDTVNNDTGSYSCRASNAAEGRMDTETFELFIQGMEVNLLLYHISPFIPSFSSTTSRSTEQ